MPHVVEPFANAGFDEALKWLQEAHGHLVARARSTLNGASSEISMWGSFVKRTDVELDGAHVPKLIGKKEEKLGELINIAATLERLMDAIRWFATRQESQGFSILKCHPSTSDDKGDNDLVIIDVDGRVTIRCEVCDVVSTRADSNGKEKKDLKSLGCNEGVPDDGVKRYICTSQEFARALTNTRRRWRSKRYKYAPETKVASSGTRLLLIEPNRST